MGNVQSTQQKIQPTQQKIHSANQMKTERVSTTNIEHAEEKPTALSLKIKQFFGPGLFVNINEDICRFKEEIIRLRTWFYTIPETSWNEMKTQNNIISYCQGIGLETTHCAKTGVIAILNSKDNSCCVALRASMDALPVSEPVANNARCKSTVDDVSHIHFHDCQIAILLMTAKILSLPKYKNKLNCSVKFIFEPGTEHGDGAKRIIAEGILEAEQKLNCPHVTDIYGFGMTPCLETGKILIMKDVFMPALATFTIFAKSHLMKSVDFVALHFLIIELTAVKKGKMEIPGHFNINIGTFSMNNAENVYTMHNDDRSSYSAEISGTVSFFESNTLKSVKQAMTNICCRIEKREHFSINLTWEDTTCPLVINSPTSVINVENAVQQVFPKQKQVIVQKKNYLHDDFAFYLSHTSGCYFMIGCATTEKKLFHESIENKESVSEVSVQVDEKSLVIGVQTLVNLIVDINK